MAQNFIACDREQELLLPPSLREWLPEDHLAWFVIDAVEAMDLTAFLRGLSRRRAGSGGARSGDDGGAVALRLRDRGAVVAADRAALHEDVAVRVICANQAPDHTTIARFRQRHEAALAGLFGEVLALCAEAGWCGSG